MTTRWHDRACSRLPARNQIHEIALGRRWSPHCCLLKPKHNTTTSCRVQSYCKTLNSVGERGRNPLPEPPQLAAREGLESGADGRTRGHPLPLPAGYRGPAPAWHPTSDDRKARQSTRGRTVGVAQARPVSADPEQTRQIRRGLRCRRELATRRACPAMGRRGPQNRSTAILTCGA